MSPYEFGRTTTSFTRATITQHQDSGKQEKSMGVPVRSEHFRKSFFQKVLRDAPFLKYFVLLLLSHTCSEVLCPVIRSKGAVEGDQMSKCEIYGLKLKWLELRSVFPKILRKSLFHKFLSEASFRKVLCPSSSIAHLL